MRYKKDIPKFVDSIGKTTKNMSEK